ncbi:MULTISPECIES: hypothetical protein [unclassified Actinobaculum]|uniref:hypothetical protein n=1 Tax=unclassified Actinobaculum TaxID=2609299 RepID=UPI000D52582B|nr:MULTISPECIES: hypothetical protein [unclassified Actinobaculum]AWE41633.1 hypothetical protein DDD63_01385 [Actinobaculum sp. 313]RTE49255.1 hypothetical protein EKN07_06705 [Actinobaculum sp. 352]
MPTWRPVHGEVIRLDPALTSVEAIEEYLAEKRIIARGHAQEEVYSIELAATGRRRRVAVLNEEGLVLPGPSLSDLLEDMDHALRKLEIRVDGVVQWGDIDLGEVDVAGDDCDVANGVDAAGTAVTGEEIRGGESGGHPETGMRLGEAVVQADGMTVRQEPADVPLEGTGTHPNNVGSRLADASVPSEEADDDPLPDYAAGPMLVLSDVPFSQVPGVAAAMGKPVAALRLPPVNALVADAPIPKRSHGSAKFTIVLSTDPSGVDKPVLSIRQDSLRVTWEWEGEFPLVAWVRDNDVAANFADEQLGVGAFVTRICTDLSDTDPQALRDALLGDPEHAGRNVAAAIGLPAEVGDCLEGLLEARSLPGAVVFEPKPFTERLQSTVAYEVSGQGVAAPGFWAVYRKLYLEHPRAMEAVATAQAGIGAILVASGTRMWHRTSGKVLAGLGGALAVNAGARILATQWIQAALEAEGLAVRRETVDDGE